MPEVFTDFIGKSLSSVQNRVFVECVALRSNFHTENEEGIVKGPMKRARFMFKFFHCSSSRLESLFLFLIILRPTLP